MTEPVLLDSGPLGQLAHPRPKHEITNWLEGLASAGIRVVVPEGADYEVRRNLLLEGKSTSLARLNDLKRRLDYLAITTSVMLKAAELWADARRRGRPSADPKELDFDVILAAHRTRMSRATARSQSESCASRVRQRP